MTIQIIHRSGREMERKKADARLGIITYIHLARKCRTGTIAPCCSVRDRSTATYYPAHIAGTSEILLKRAQTFQ